MTSDRVERIRADLPPRQREVLELLLRGRSVKEIAAELSISVHTAQDNVKRLHQQFEVRSRAELLIRLLAPQNLDRPFQGCGVDRPCRGSSAAS